jgi:hypothetical protein
VQLLPSQVSQFILKKNDSHFLLSSSNIKTLFLCGNYKCGYQLACFF